MANWAHPAPDYEHPTPELAAQMDDDIAASRNALFSPAELAGMFGECEDADKRRARDGQRVLDHEGNRLPGRSRARSARLGGCDPARVRAWASGDASEAEAILRERGEHTAADAVAELAGTARRTVAMIRAAMLGILAGVQ
jgi:hypothetical protein